MQLPQACKLSEDSDESLESSRTGSRNNHKKENNRDTIEKLAQQLTQPGTTSDQLQVIKIFYVNIEIVRKISNFHVEIFLIKMFTRVFNKNDSYFSLSDL